MKNRKKRAQLSDADWGFGEAESEKPKDLLPAALSKPPSEALDLFKLSPEAKAFVGAAKAPETQRVYKYHWRVFERWAKSRGFAALPADSSTIADYASFRALHGVTEDEASVDLSRDERLRAAEEGRAPVRSYAERWKVSTVRQALAAIRLMHRYNGFPNPCDSITVEEVMKGIAAVAGAKPVRKDAISVEQLRLASRALGNDLKGKRDRALLLLGFAAMLRRGELAALEVGDLRWEAGGLVLDLRRHFSGSVVVPGTKANRGGARDEAVGVTSGEHEETCPVRAVRTWLSDSKIAEGRVFRAVRQVGAAPEAVGEPLTPQTVALVVKDALARVGLDPKTYAGHSLRAGGATSAARAGKSLPAIQRQTRHANLDMLMRYIREAGLFEDNASEGIGL